MTHAAFLRTHPVFTGEELSRHLASRGHVGPRAREALLAYYRKAGRIVRVRRGLYAVVPPGSDADTYPVDHFLVAAKLTSDAVLSHHTALEFFGRAYSVHHRFIYSAGRPLSPVTFRAHVFQGANFPAALVRARQENTGVVAAERAGLPIRVTNLERTLVDVLERQDLGGSWEEIWRSLESVEFFDLDQVVAYTRLVANATTAAKVGFFLHQHRAPLMVEDRHLDALRNLRPRQPHYLDRTRRKPGRLVPEWNLVVPGDVLDRAWGEVL
jgi:predicted transcriptional regulator of viral defense system